MDAGCIAVEAEEDQSVAVLVVADYCYVAEAVETGDSDLATCMKAALENILVMRDVAVDVLEVVVGRRSFDSNPERPCLTMAVGKVECSAEIAVGSDLAEVVYAFVKKV